MQALWVIREYPKTEKIKKQIQASWHKFTKSVHNTFLQHHLYFLSPYQSTVRRYIIELLEVTKTTSRSSTHALSLPVTLSIELSRIKLIYRFIEAILSVVYQLYVLVSFMTLDHLSGLYPCSLKDIISIFRRNSPQWARASSFLRFLDHTQQRTTVGRTPLYEWSVRRRDLYLTTYNTHKRQTSMPLVGFEPTIPASEQPETYALDRAATGTGWLNMH